MIFIKTGRANIYKLTQPLVICRRQRPIDLKKGKLPALISGLQPRRYNLVHHMGCLHYVFIRVPVPPRYKSISQKEPEITYIRYMALAFKKHLVMKIGTYRCTQFKGR